MKAFHLSEYVSFGLRQLQFGRACRFELREFGADQKPGFPGVTMAVGSLLR